MLALATHEVHFAILREDVHTFRQNDKSQKFGKNAPLIAHQHDKQEVKQKEAAGTDVNDDGPRQNFQILFQAILSLFLEMLMFIELTLGLCRSSFRNSPNLSLFFGAYLGLSCIKVLKINPEKMDIDSFVAADFTLVGYDPHQKIEMKMAI